MTRNDMIAHLVGALAGIGAGTLVVLAILGMASLLGGCATSHTVPTAAPDGGAPAFQGDGGPDECLAWGHPEGFPEDVRCTLWAGEADAGARGCKIAPFYGPGDPAGACAVQ